MTIKDGIYLFLLLLVLAIAAWIYQQGRNNAERGGLAAVIRQEQAVAAAVAAEQIKSAKAVSDYESEIAGLHNAALAAGQPVVRLCPRPSGGPVPGPAVAAAGTEKGPATAGNGNGVPGGTAERPDIGPELRAIAEVADRLAAQEREIIQWTK